MTSMTKASSVDEMKEIEERKEKRGTWWPVKDLDGSRSAIITCPGCGQTHSLCGRWKVASDGSVTPSVDHSQPIVKTDGSAIRDCLFHDHVKLEGWIA